MGRYAKYHNVKTEIDGIVFDSKWEATYYGVLKLRACAGEIQNLRTQVPFELFAGFRDRTGKKHAPITYFADFAYTENGVAVVVDTKSSATVTDVFRIKHKLFLFRYPEIRFEIVQKCK